MKKRKLKSPKPPERFINVKYYIPGIDIYELDGMSLDELISKIPVGVDNRYVKFEINTEQVGYDSYETKISVYYEKLELNPNYDKKCEKYNKKLEKYLKVN